MNRKRPGLGKGLDALIPMDEDSQIAPLTPSEPSASGAEEIAIDLINPNPRQPRTKFNEDGIKELAASIKEHGVIQPLIVTQEVQGLAYTLIAGERRLLASKEAGLKTVPVIIRDASEQARLELALIENVQRADLSPLETAEAYYQLSVDFNLKHEEIADRVGKSREAVSNTLRLRNLPPSIKQALSQGDIREGHARALLGLPSAQSQVNALQTVLAKKLNVRGTEELVKKLKGEKPAPKPKVEPAPEIIDLQDRIGSALGTKVTMKHGKKGGTITIHYYSDEELDSLVDKFEQH